MNMKIYYFAKEVNTRNAFYGDGKRKRFESRRALIKDAKKFFESDAKKVLTKEVLNSIVYEEVPDYDFYSVQEIVDGFGHDTSTVAIFRTEEECSQYLEKTGRGDLIKGQYWGEYEEEWD
jgi:hypothetical protein